MTAFSMLPVVFDIGTVSKCDAARLECIDGVLNLAGKGAMVSNLDL